MTVHADSYISPRGILTHLKLWTYVNKFVFKNTGVPYQECHNSERREERIAENESTEIITWERFVRNPKYISKLIKCCSEIYKISKYKVMQC